MFWSFVHFFAFPKTRKCFHFFVWISNASRDIKFATDLIAQPGVKVLEMLRECNEIIRLFYVLCLLTLLVLFILSLSFPFYCGVFLYFLATCKFAWSEWVSRILCGNKDGRGWTNLSEGGGEWDEEVADWGKKTHFIFDSLPPIFISRPTRSNDFCNNLAPVSRSLYVTKSLLFT